jgi:adenylosuccinate synthase
LYSRHEGWSGDLSRVRRFAELPPAARRYVAAMMGAIVDTAYAGGARPADERLPNLRYLGIGPEPAQIIKDVPATGELLRLR